MIEVAPELASAAALGERVIVPGPDGWIELTWPESDATGSVVALNVAPTTGYTSSETPLLTSNGHPLNRTDSIGQPSSLSPTRFDATPWLTALAATIALLVGAAAATRIARGRWPLSDS